MKIPERFKNSILAGWIFAGVIALLVPMIFVIISAGYSRRLLREKIEEMSRITLNNLQYSIDGYLNDLREAAYYCLSDSGFLLLEKLSAGGDAFLPAADECFRVLKSRGEYGKGIDYLIYFPANDYILTDQTAGYAGYVYDSIYYNSGIKGEGREMVSGAEWRFRLGQGYRNDCLISDLFSYESFGKPSLVYAFTNPYSGLTGDTCRMTVFTSVSCAFIEALLNEADHSGLFLIDGDGNQLGQFGTLPSMTVEGWSDMLCEDDRERSFLFGKERYSFSYIPSDIADWYYVLAVPESLYFNSTRNVRNMTIIGILMTVCFGLSVTILLHTKNYRQISSIMKLLPDSRKREHGKNELDMLYSFYSDLNRENLTLKQLFELRKDSIRRMFWMDKLKGRSSYLSDDDMMNSLQLSMQKIWVIAAVDTECRPGTGSEYMGGELGLLRFSVNNVVKEVFSGRYTLECLEDGGLILILFSISEEEVQEWKADSPALFTKIYEFFRERFSLSLTVVVSGLCERFDNLSACYSAVQEVVQYQSIVKRSGVVYVEEIAGQKMAEAEFWEEYRRRCILLAAGRNESGMRVAVDELFSKGMGDQETFGFLRFQVFSLVAAVLLRSRDTLTGHGRDSLEKRLRRLTESETWIDMKLICLDILTGLAKAEDHEEEGTDQDRLVMGIKEYVEDNYPDKELNISSIAERFRLSPGYVSRLFRQETGVGLLSFVNDIRIRKAQELLRSTKYTVYEVAEMVGYTNVRSFQRNFIANVGTAPNEYRVRSRPDL